MSWTIPLEGHQFDLEDLPHWLAGHEVRVDKRDDTFVLVIPTAVAGDSYEPVRKFAESHLALINGVGSLLSPQFRPVMLSDELYGLDSAGKIVHKVLALTGEEIRLKGADIMNSTPSAIKVHHRDGAALPLLVAASGSTRRHDALVIVGRASLTWSELYLVFELVEAEVGGQMFRLGWVSEANVELFNLTANSYSVLRSEGRHGKDSGNPPPSAPMQRAVAVELIRGLVFSWLSNVGASSIV